MILLWYNQIESLSAVISISKSIILKKKNRIWITSLFTTKLELNFSHWHMIKLNLTFFIYLEHNFNQLLLTMKMIANLKQLKFKSFFFTAIYGGRSLSCKSIGCIFSMAQTLKKWKFLKPHFFWYYLTAIIFDRSTPNFSYWRFQCQKIFNFSKSVRQKQQTFSSKVFQNLPKNGLWTRCFKSFRQNTASIVHWESSGKEFGRS